MTFTLTAPVSRCQCGHNLTNHQHAAIGEGIEPSYCGYPECTCHKFKLQILHGCNVCGGDLVQIRARSPHGEKRIVCPTCLQEKLDEIESTIHIGCVKDAT